MKILHCIRSPHIGGIERLVIELAVEQKKQGIDVTIMLDTRDGQFYNYLLKKNIKIIDSGVKNGFDFKIRIYRNLKKYFQEYDIIHLHSFSVIRSLAVKGSNSIYTIHGLSKGVEQKNKFKHFFKEILINYFINRVDCLVANSHYTLKMAKKHYGLKNICNTTVYNGIKLPINQNNGDSRQEHFTIGMVSRFTPRKRIERLVNGFELFIQMGGNGKLILIGNGSTFDNIKDLIRKKELNDLVEVKGYLSNVEDFYPNFDITVFPSENEPFGLVGVEAYNFGKPVIAFADSGGLKEVIEPIEPDDIVLNENELAERILYYYKNPSTILNRSAKRKAYAQKMFSIERMEREYFGLYQKILRND